MMKCFHSLYIIVCFSPDGSPWQPKKHTRICSQHFIGNKKSEHPLSPSFIPTIFSSENLKTECHGKAATERFERSLKRQGAIIVKETDQKRQAVTTIERSLDNSNEFTLMNDNLSNEAGSVKEMRNQETQVDFLEEPSICNIFICNRYVNNNISDAEVQACFPFVENSRKVKNIIQKGKGCGTSNVVCIDECVGPNPIDLNERSLIKCSTGFHGSSSIKCDQEMLDLGGVTLANFRLLLKISPESTGGKMSKENRLLIFLFKMKLGLTFSALSVLFNVHRSTISRIFFAMLTYLSQACVNFVIWPSREAVQATMPNSFKNTYEDCRVIIDCTEIKVEQPPTIEDRVHLYSHYKKGFTVKVLVGCTPNGVISFVSKCFGGRTTDAQITISSGFLELLEPGDLILADKGFPEIKTVLQDDGRGVLFVMPPFLHNGEFTAQEVAATYKIVSVRIHYSKN